MPIVKAVIIYTKYMDPLPENAPAGGSREGLRLTARPTLHAGLAEPSDQEEVTHRHPERQWPTFHNTTDASLQEAQSSGGRAASRFRCLFLPLPADPPARGTQSSAKWAAEKICREGSFLL